MHRRRDARHDLDQRVLAQAAVFTKGAGADAAKLKPGGGGIRHCVEVQKIGKPSCTITIGQTAYCREIVVAELILCLGVCQVCSFAQRASGEHFQHLRHHRSVAVPLQVPRQPTQPALGAAVEVEDFIHVGKKAPPSATEPGRGMPAKEVLEPPPRKGGLQDACIRFSGKPCQGLIC